jgi:hypothetical protein
MPEDREESGHDEPSANPKEEARGKHSLIRALLRTVHEIQFSLQNSLTVAGILSSRWWRQASSRSAGIFQFPRP